MNHQSVIRRRQSIFHDFLSNTSTHALPNVSRSRTVWNRIFWLISFIVFTGLMIYFIIKAFLAYYEYPTTVDTSFMPDQKQLFPAVSFCLYGGSKLESVIGPLSNYAASINVTLPNDTVQWSSTESLLIRNFFASWVDQDLSTDSFFFSLPSLMISCTFNSKSCSASEFTRFSSQRNGYCYTFNAKSRNISANPMRTATMNGGSGLLELKLYTHRHQAVPTITEGTGFIITVHNNVEIPLVETSALLLEPGKHHRLSYRKRIIQFLPKPYTECSEEVSPALQNMLQYYYTDDYGYSQILCLQICQQSYVYVKCGCTSPKILTLRWVMNYTTNQAIKISYCNRSDPCYTNAADELSSNSDLSDYYCGKCTQKCAHTHIIVQKSSVNMPMPWNRMNIKKFVENSSISLPVNWSSIWQDEVDKNYVSVEIVRETPVVEYNTQVASLSFIDLLSNIGGQSGLWIGSSFLSVMELLEMTYMLLERELHHILLFMRR